MTPTELAALPDGTRLVVSIPFENPCGDKRTKHDWRVRPLISKGLQLVVVKYKKGPENDFDHIVLRPVTGWHHQEIYLRPDGSVPPNTPFADLYQMLLSYVEVAPNTFESIAAFHYSEPSYFAHAIVDELLATGRLTLDEVEDLYNANNKRHAE